MTAVIGSKGIGKQSAPGSSTEAANTLRSDVIVNMIEAIGEGQIHGLVNGGNSIYFDNTPLQNTDSTYNFVGVEWDQRVGAPAQAALPGPNQTSTPFTVETQVKHSAAVIRTIDDPTAGAVQVIMRLPALALANQVTGDVTGTDVAYNIDIRASGGAWVNAVAVSLNNQKCTSPYQKAHVLTRPAGTDPWDIRVVRLTADPDPVEANFLQNQTWWQSYSTLVAGSYTYDDTAVISLYVNAFLFGTSLGTRAYHVRGLLIDIPSNYDAIHHTYTGVWDGTFVRAWSNNPAWIFWDLLTNTRYGIGEFVDLASVDKWSLYQIGQYCDALVPSGFKNSAGADILEPRYMFNGVINNREEAYKVLQNITTAFRGMAYWSLGQVFCAADMPSDPVVGLTPANVIGGHFKYSGTAMKARHSVAVLSWNDPNNFFRATPEIVQDDEQIRRFGWRQTDVQLIGCTSRGQAHRFGKWILDSERNQTETIQFSMSWDGYVLKNNEALKPGDIFLVTDPRKNGSFRAGGRLAHVTSTTAMTLDFPFPPESGQTYTLSALLPDGSFETKIVTGFGSDHMTVTMTEAFSHAPVTNADFIIQSADMVARQYRVMAIQEDGENIFKITGLIHDPSKFARVEDGLALVPIQYVRPRNIVSQPTNITASEARFFQNGVSHSRVTLSWTGPNDFMVRDYLVTADSPHGFVAYPATTMPLLDIMDAAAGNWIFHISARSGTGLTSVPVPFSFTVQGWQAVDGPIPTGLDTIPLGGGAFTGRSPTITWTNVFPPNYVQYNVTNVVRVYDLADHLLRTELVTTPSYTYDYDKNVNDGGPRRSVRIDVTAKNVTGVESAPATVVVANPTPAKEEPRLVGDIGSIDVSWLINDKDYAGAYVWRSTSSGFVPTLDNASYIGPDTKITLWVDRGTWYVWLGLFDAFGTAGMIVSDPQSIVVNDLNSTLAAVIPDLIAAEGQVTTTLLNVELENVADQIAGILNQIVLDRDFNDNLHQRAVQELSVKTDGASADIISEQTARIEAGVAEATARTVLQVTLNNNIIASVASEATARVTADAALTTQIALANSAIAGNTASILTEATTRATADSAQSTLLTQLTSTVTTNNNTVTASILTEATTRATADTALTTQINQANSAIAGNTASILSETTTRATADSALSASYSALSTTVGSNTATLSTVQNSVNGVSVQYGVIGNIDGATGGFLFTGIKRLDGSVSFAVEIAGNLIVDGTIAASKLTVNNLSAVSANMGTVTAGVIKSSDFKTVWDLTAGTLTVSD